MVGAQLDPTSRDFRLEWSPFYLIAHADFRYHEDMESVMSKHGLNMTMYRILTVLREEGAASVSDLSQIALTKRTTMSRIVDQMEAAGLVTKAPLASDNRVTMVTRSAKGSETLADLTPVAKRQIGRALQGLSKAEVDQMVGTLRKIVANLAKLSIE